MNSHGEKPVVTYDGNANPVGVELAKTTRNDYFANRKIDPNGNL
jgi:hypothetical protein